MTRVVMPALALALALIAAVAATVASAQPLTQPLPAALGEEPERLEQASMQQPLPPVRRAPLCTISAHLLFGRVSLRARDSFTAVLGTSAGQIFGGGAELTFRGGVFVRGDVSYFTSDGERVELIDGEIVPLGIPLRLSLTPIEFTGGYRFTAWRFGSRGQAMLVPIVGVGAGLARYHEETDADHPEENVSERHASLHILLGVEVPLGRRVAIGAELTRRWVPDGLGTGGISQQLGETDLGGSTGLVRIRIVF